ncbi:tyrosine-protein phosphatase [Staphylococcus cohnii]|uniref:tyrosine-protein phosphatase n=1 Tax=Staphylococcus cohnii TaxID=29382 RepID=UPI00186783BE|nr:CpsB/CapC family capsule biosynthesis tyrosine phosphatase [Staphylococcus cohnii]
MIDIHNHILIGADDGPKTKEDAISLITQAKEEGITSVVATPHHLHSRYSNTVSNVKSKVNEIISIEEIKKLNIEIYYGQEIRITDQILSEIKNGDIVGINNSRYLLIELPSNEVPHYTHSLLNELQVLGYIPIIVHPERNRAIAQNLDLLFQLINGGALSQITSTSLNGSMGKNIKKITLQMIDNNLTHFIASDAHSVNERPFLMKSLLNDKKLKNYKEEISELIENAKLIIEDQKLMKKIPTQDYNYKKKFGIFK